MSSRAYSRQWLHQSFPGMQPDTGCKRFVMTAALDRRSRQPSFAELQTSKALPDDFVAGDLRELTAPGAAISWQAAGIGSTPWVSATETGIWLFHGRLDNRRELQARFGESDETSDAVLASTAFHRLGLESLAELDGPFVAVHWCSKARKAVMIRGPLGERSLYYRVESNRLWIAGDEQLLMREPKHREEDPVAVAHFFAQRPVPESRTFVKSIRRVPAASATLIDANYSRTERYWSPRKTYVHRKDRDYEEEFLSTLTSSVDQCLENAPRSALLLSGGIASSSIATLAAARAKSTGAPPPQLISWVFHREKACDQRKEILKTAQWLNQGVYMFFGDELGPESGDPPMEGPFIDPRYRLLDSAFELAQRLGVKQVLAGWTADELHAGSEGWLLDLLRGGRLGTLSKTVFHSALAGVPGFRALAYGLAQMIHPLPRMDPAPIGLTPYSIDLIEQPHSELRLGLQARRVNQLLRGPHVSSLTAAQRRADRFGLEVRAPFWNRRLIELMLSMPLYFLRRGLEEKYVARRAMKALLPESVSRTRRAERPAGGLFLREFMHRQRETATSLIAEGRPAWQSYLDPDWVNERLSHEIGSSTRSADLWWRLATYSRWRKAVDLD